MGLIDPGHWELKMVASTGVAEAATPEDRRSEAASRANRQSRTSGTSSHGSVARERQPNGWRAARAISLLKSVKLGGGRAGSQPVRGAPFGR